MLTKNKKHQPETSFHNIEGWTDSQSNGNYTN